MATDFIEGLPKVSGSVVLIVVDRFSKYAHFIRAFFVDIVCLHGIQSSIMSDRDPVFTSNIWKGLFSLAGVKLHLTTAEGTWIELEYILAKKGKIRICFARPVEMFLVRFSYDLLAGSTINKQRPSPGVYPSRKLFRA